VLPFTNLSGDAKQEYFSDGMTEELINALSQINALKVIARTSSFSFKGTDADIGTIARKLNVAAILEGSVRRSGNKVRITAQLINAVNGFHVWSQDYDRDLNNVLVLQTDIAKAVAGVLQAKLLGDEAPKIELGGTHNAGALDAYLRGAKAYSSSPDSAQDLQTAIAAYTEAIALDPNYALAFAGRSVAYSGYASEYAKGAAIRAGFDKAQADARKAIALAPDLAEGHLALARLLEAGSLNFAQASEAYERALALAPGNAEVLRESGRFAVHIGHFDVGLAAVERAVALDPLNPRSRSQLGRALYFARRYPEAAAAFAELITLDPDNKFAFGARGLAQFGMGDLQSARSSCEIKADHWVSQWCLALAYDKLGRHSDAESVLAKMKTANGAAAAYQYATIYAQWGKLPQSLEWLDAAVHARDPGLPNLKADPLMDPLRKERRFQAIERRLSFPD
jgi:TolB-like protein/Tfp pilus assembly protein PilF